jgi:hypothetical protein
VWHAVLTFAAAANEDGAGEPSKLPFYVAGMLLVAFSVLVGALGIVKHDFPATRGARSAVLAVCTLLVIAAMATSVLTA